MIDEDHHGMNQHRICEGGDGIGRTGEEVEGNGHGVNEGDLMKEDTMLLVDIPTTTTLIILITTTGIPA